MAFASAPRSSGFDHATSTESSSSSRSFHLGSGFFEPFAMDGRSSPAARVDARWVDDATRAGRGEVRCGLVPFASAASSSSASTTRRPRRAMPTAFIPR